MSWTHNTPAQWEGETSLEGTDDLEAMRVTARRYGIIDVDGVLNVARAREVAKAWGVKLPKEWR